MSEKTQKNIQKVIERHEDYIKKYSVYHAKSIVLPAKKYPAYNSLLAAIANASKEALELKEKNEKFVKIDGVNIDFEISTASEIKIAQAHSPNAQSNPLLYELLSRSLKIGDEHNVQTFLGKY
ncbi:hypothetical protein [Mucilaginibacter antarcticus]